MPNNNIKILLVEDDPFLLNMYAAKFEIEHFEVVIADDGEKGFAKAISDKPDIILLDIMLPRMDGFEVLQKLKATESVKDIPVILLSNLSQKDEIEKGMRLGAVDFLIKAHFMPSEVVDKIQKTLGAK